MGVRIFRIILPALLGLFLTGKVCTQPIAQPIQVTRPAIQVSAPAPLQDRMRTWKMAHKHPDARYLNTKEAFSEVDNKPRIYEFIWPIYGLRPGQVRSVLVWTGRDAWRPDPSAQVDELRARLMDVARLEGWK